MTPEVGFGSFASSVPALRSASARKQTLQAFDGLLACLEEFELPERRVPHFIHVDEFQSFTTDAFASIFSEARKFAAYFCLANQYTRQIPEIVRAAVLGNAGSFISFCVAAADAELLAPEFSVLPSAPMEQLPFEAWLRRGNLEHAKITALPRAFPPRNRRRATITQSRRHFGRPSAQLEGLS